MKHHSNGRAYLNFAGLGEEGEELVRSQLRRQQTTSAW